LRPKLALMCGLPGSGKTTLARKLAAEIPAIRLCADEWQAALKVDHSDEDFHDLLEDQPPDEAELGLFAGSIVHRRLSRLASPTA
jgi:broad-specificity NMP kinase